MIGEAEVEIRYGRARVVVEADAHGVFSDTVLSELREAIVKTCLAMDTDDARKLATRVEGAA